MRLVIYTPNRGPMPRKDKTLTAADLRDRTNSAGFSADFQADGSLADNTENYL